MSETQSLTTIEGRGVSRKDEAALPSLILLQSIKQITDLLGLPPNAIPSLFLAHQTRVKVHAMVQRQVRLKEDQRKALVRVKAGTGLTSLAMQQIDAYCQANDVPYNMVAFLQGGPYPLTEARHLHLIMDPRCLKDIIYTERALVTEGPNPHAVYECSIEFWSGATVRGEAGSCSAEEMTDMRRTPTLHNIIAQAKTRAFNRAAGRAIVFVGAAAIEDDAVIQQAPTGTVVQFTGEATTEPRNPIEALSMAYQKYGINRKDLTEKLGYDPKSKPVAELWADIQKLVGAEVKTEEPKQPDKPKKKG